MDKLLSIKNLKADLITPRGIVHAVRDINMEVRAGEIHGIVGESGCGKTVSAKSILRLLDDKTIYGGSICYKGKNILEMPKKELLSMRGGEISMVFQDPAITLNPIVTVGKQMVEMLRLHTDQSKEQARSTALKLLESVGIFPSEKRFNQYPFELSGGMLQRISIAMAISCNPSLLIADEPTTALDVTMQAQILKILKGLQEDRGMSVLIITHNFGIVAEICDWVSVMYAGKILESGDVNAIFKSPQHPYTKDLISSIPQGANSSARLTTIPGSPPDLRKHIVGCPYAPRCRFASEQCRESAPQLRSAQGTQGHVYACHIDEAERHLAEGDRNE